MGSGRLEKITGRHSARSAPAGERKIDVALSMARVRKKGGFDSAKVSRQGKSSQAYAKPV
jgi:hypothetical protein